MKAKKIETKKSKRNLRVNLDQSELLTYGKRQADLLLELNRIEADKKRIIDDFKSKTSAVEADVQILSNALSTGYEYRDVNCTEYLGDPEPDCKRIVRDDIGEQVAVEKMTAMEMQRELLNTEEE
jgi:hypothetical protein